MNPKHRSPDAVRSTLGSTLSPTLQPERGLTNQARRTWALATCASLALVLSGCSQLNSLLGPPDVGVSSPEAAGLTAPKAAYTGTKVVLRYRGDLTAVVQTSGPNVAYLTDAKASTVTFIPAEAGDYRFSVTSVQAGSSVSASVTVSVADAPPGAPALAYEIQVLVGQSLLLNFSEPQEGASCTWLRASAPADSQATFSSVVNSPSSCLKRFTADSPGKYLFSVTAKNTSGTFLGSGAVAVFASNPPTPTPTTPTPPTPPTSAPSPAAAAP